MKNITLFIVLLFSLAFFPGCKSTDNGGTVLISGRLVYDCSERPHANEAITFRMVNNEGIQNKDTYDDVGSGTTDAQGYFSITCENHGIVDVYIKQTRHIANITGGNGKTFDIGTIYDQFTESALLKIIFTTPHSDTLYIGNSSIPQAIIYPASGIKYATITNSSSFFISPRGSSLVLNYSYGKANFNTTSSPPQIRAENAYKICGIPDTTEITLP